MQRYYTIQKSTFFSNLACTNNNLNCILWKLHTHAYIDTVILYYLPGHYILISVFLISIYVNINIQSNSVVHSSYKLKNWVSTVIKFCYVLL